MEKSKVVVAYYMIPKDGGFQLRKLLIEEDVVLADEKASDPDAWPEVMNVLDHALSLQFA